TRTNHVLGCAAQNIRILPDLLKTGLRLRQYPLVLLAGTASEQKQGQQQHATEHHLRHYCSSPNCVRRRARRAFSSSSCFCLFSFSTLASARRASSSACSASTRARL